MDAIFEFILIPLIAASLLIGAYGLFLTDNPGQKKWAVMILWLFVAGCFFAICLWEQMQQESVRVVVLDANSQPIPNVTVSYGSEINFLTVKGTATTNAAGETLISAVKLRSLTLSASCAGFISQSAQVITATYSYSGRTVPLKEWRVDYNWYQHWGSNGFGLSQRCTGFVPNDKPRKITFLLRPETSLRPLPIAHWIGNLSPEEKIKAADGCLEGLVFLYFLPGNSSLQCNYGRNWANQLAWLETGLLDISLDLKTKKNVSDDHKVLLSALTEWACGHSVDGSDLDKTNLIQTQIELRRDLLLDYLKPFLLTQENAYQTLDQLQDLCGPAIAWYPDLLKQTTGPVHAEALRTLERLRCDPKWVEPLLTSSDPEKIPIALTVLKNTRRRYFREISVLLQNFIPTTSDPAFRQQAQQILKQY